MTHKEPRHQNMSRRRFLELSATTVGATLLGGVLPRAAGAAPLEPASQVRPYAPAVASPVVIRALLSPGTIVTYLQECAAEYKKLNPDVEFEWNIMEQEQKRTVELQIITGEDAPDFAWINYGSGLTDKMVQAGAIVNLDKYYEQYKWWDVLADHLHTHEYQGSMYHFSVSSVTTPLMWYNKSLMAKAGQPPATKDDLFSWAEACHAQGLEPLAMGDRDGWPGFHMYQCIASRTVPLADYEKILHFDKEEIYMKDYPGFAEAFQLMRDMQDKQVWAKGVLDMNDDQAQQMVLTGSAVSYETGVWAIANLRKGLGDDLDFFLFPQINPEIPTPLTASYADEFVMSSHSKVQDQVADFFNFVLSKDGQRIVAKVGSMPIRTDLTSADMEGFADPMTGKVTELFGSGKYPVTDEIVTFWPAELYALLRENVQSAIGGLKTPEQIVEEFDSLAAEFRAKAAE
jgi:raffinose/stachyose/melibiose transport system substrate-binding protein